ncbi:MAG: endopeptidase La [Clostridia bacterium]|nr:endopeptidase La [Clostridia bacterium]
MTQTIENVEKLEENKNDEKIKVVKDYVALHLSNIVPVPGVGINCDLNSENEMHGMKQAFDSGERLIIVSSKNGEIAPEPDQLFEYGCVAVIKKVTKQGNVMKVLIDGVARAKIENVRKSGNQFIISATELSDEEAHSSLAYNTMRLIQDKCRESGKFDRFLPPEVENQILYSNLPPAQFSDMLTHLVCKEVAQQQKLLAEVNVVKRLEFLKSVLEQLISKIMWKREIDDKVNANISKNQKEMFLREQLHVINEELNGDVDEIETFTEKVKALGMPKESEEKVLKEIKRLGKLPFGSPELGYIRNFVETVLELPWTQRTEDNIDMKKAKKVLDDEHYALDKVKQRIMETLAVMKLTNKTSAQIVCLVGPPGVGKTSIAKSIATAMGRTFVQVSLGGVSDESVIRGHRRTYVGAMCGRILAGMKQAGTVNPVFLLDEVDKITKDIKGDPASALLEVLDPAQNDHFKDNFLEIPYDLSQVLFILTANSLSTIPTPLLDRMEVIQLRSYTEFEKIEIAKRYLISKQEKLAGLKEGTVILDEELIRKIIQEYTYESGVRGLERQVASICRKYASNLAEGKEIKQVTIKNLHDFLGDDYNLEQKLFQGGNIGEVVGLATNATGIGSCLLIECAQTKGSGKLLLTGQMGKVIKESANAAYSLVKQLSDELEIKADFNKVDLHLHFPAMPYGVEGPSAGIATVVAMASAFTERKVKPSLAMTGEVSLRGRVLPVGGVRDKLIAANRSGIKTIIIPKDNERDLKDLPKNVRESFDINIVTNIKEVLNIALEPAKKSSSKKSTKA